MGESELFFAYVGNITDSCRDHRLKWTYGGAPMAHYDPETLTILRKVLDEAWAACTVRPEKWDEQNRGFPDRDHFHCAIACRAADCSIELNHC